MANFNTNQTRQFYVASTAATTAPSDVKGIGIKATSDNDLYFLYKNADGVLTRSDTFKVSNIKSLKKTLNAAMCTTLMENKIVVDTDIVTLSSMAGKVMNMDIALRQFMGYSSSDAIHVLVSLTPTATQVASAAAFYNAFAKAIVAATPKLVDAPYKVYVTTTSSGTVSYNEVTASSETVASADSIRIVAAQLHWVRGKMSNEPFEITVSTSAPALDSQWAAVTCQANGGNFKIKAEYKLADLEYFALGERGDQYRGSIWPNNIEPTYCINPADNTTYDVLSVEYFYAGGAENVQKSPRMIQVAAPTAAITTLYNFIADKMDPNAGKIGDLSTLETTAKSSVVAAINEIHE